MKKRLCVLLLFISGSLCAQNPKFIRHEISRDKKDLKITRLTQSKQGFLWIGTQYGLYRYDGVSSQLYPFPDSGSSAEVTALYEDRQQRIWIGCSSGNIFYFTGSEIEKFNPDEG